MSDPAPARQALAAGLLLFCAFAPLAAHAQNIDCTSASDSADCTLTVEARGAYFIESTANVTNGSGSPSVWVETYVDGQMCGQRVTVTLRAAEGYARGSCTATLEPGRPYKISAKSGVQNATPASVNVTYRGVNVVNGTPVPQN